MSRFEQRRWTAALGAFGGRRSRQSFLYRTFVPDDLAKATFHLSSEVGHGFSPQRFDVKDDIAFADL